MTWTATATDAEDAVAPTPSCAPASGSTFPLGQTTVHCTVTDGGGLVVDGSFVVTVDDTIGPRIVGLPADQHLTTSDPSGTTLPVHRRRPRPTPPIPIPVGCLPASGSHIGGGDDDGHLHGDGRDRQRDPGRLHGRGGLRGATSRGARSGASPSPRAEPSPPTLAGRSRSRSRSSLMASRQARGSAVLTLTTCGWRRARLAAPDMGWRALERERSIRRCSAGPAAMRPRPASMATPPARSGLISAAPPCRLPVMRRESRRSDRGRSGGPGGQPGSPVDRTPPPGVLASGRDPRARGDPQEAARPARRLPHEGRPRRRRLRRQGAEPAQPRPELLAEGRRRPARSTGSGASSTGSPTSSTR